jgi:hypothetical protein
MLTHSAALALRGTIAATASAAAVAISGTTEVYTSRVNADVAWPRRTPQPCQRPASADSMSRQRIIAPLTDRESAAARSVLGLVKSGKKILAIKEYRQATGRSLADSKDVIDALGAGTLVLDTPAPPPVLVVVCSYCQTQATAGARCGNCGKS